MRVQVAALVALLAAVVASGCSSDPCDGVAGSCISVRVEGSVAGLDQLRLSLDGVAAPMLTPTVPRSISLPVKLAVGLSATTTSPANLTIAGLKNSVVIAEDQHAVSFAAGQHVKFTFHLTAFTALDGGVGDDLSSSDLGDDGGSGFVPPAGTVSLYPSTIAFPNTTRGKTSAPMTLTVYNRTNADVSSGNGTSTGDQNDFQFIGAAPATCMTSNSGVTVPANADCTISIQFEPTASGLRTQMLTLPFSNGTTLALTLTGDGVATWVAENIPQLDFANVNLTGVWASSPTDVYATSSLGTLSLWHSQGDGNWTAVPVDGAATTQVSYAITGNGASQVWAGYANNVVAWNGTTWTNETAAATNVVSLATLGTGNGVYALSGSTILRNTGTAAWDSIITLPAGVVASSIAPGPNGNTLIVTGANGYVSYVSASGSGAPTTLTTNTTLPINGAWQIPFTTDFYVVGNTSSEGSVTPTLMRCNTTSTAPTCTQESNPAVRSLNAIVGRSLPSGGLDVYAIGLLGTEVIHSDGSGTWTAVSTPQHGGMISAFILPSGELYVVGEQGQINHYLN